MRIDLTVPFAEKDAAKKLGARWDAARKIWYVAAQEDMAPFAKWSPTPHDELRAAANPQKSSPAADFTKLADALAQVPLSDLGPFQAAAG